MKREKLNNLFRTVSVVLPLLLFMSLPAAAASGIEISTTYPGISASAGELITFSLDVNNSGSQSRVVQLRIDSCPEGWIAYIEGKGQGRRISEVFVKGGSYESANLNVRIPENVGEGNYTLSVSALSGGSVLDTLKINVDISKVRMGADQLSAQYSELKGSAGATFNFNLTLANNGSEEQTYSLGADLPSGWQVTFMPSYEQQEVASITVAGGQKKDLKVTIKPASSAEAGEYVIPVYAVSGGSEAKTELKVIVSGSYELAFSTPTGQLNFDMVAGKEKKITMEVKNTGSAPLKKIKFYSSTPKDWSVDYDPKEIEVLEPGESQQITATVTASSNAIAGDYALTLRASASETSKQADFRVTVKTSTLWGIVGIVIILAVCAGVYWVFHNYGRR